MKKEIRDSMLQKRNSLSKEEILEKSKKIEENIMKLEQYTKAKSVMYFVSFGSEVHTHDIIKNALGKKTIIVPKVANNEIEPSVIIDFDNLVPSGKFRILEPMDTMHIANKGIELIFVAGLAFDKEGYRIGYGVGYYDRFLKKVPKALKIGLAFDFQVMDRLPREQHDVPVDMIVTDKEIIDCRK